MKLLSRICALLLLAFIFSLAFFTSIRLRPGSQSPRAQTWVTGSAVAIAPMVASAQATTPTITAVGRVEAVKARPVVLQVGGIVSQLDVKIGQRVKSGELLLTIDGEGLEAAVVQGEITLEQAKISLQAVTETVDASSLEVAEADLLVAQERLRQVEAGPTKEELEAAKSSAAAAWSTYNTLQAGPTQSELTQASANLKLAELDVQTAQRAYDAIKWQSDVGTTPEAAALQRATITYESAKASYDILTKGPRPADLQKALADAQTAQNTLNLLLKQPIPADKTAAKAVVTTAQAAVTRLKSGSKAGQIRSAELAVEQAKIALDEARRNLVRARVTAPVAGVLLEVNARVGDSVSANSVAFVIIDMANLQATVNVEQGFLPIVKVGQKADVSIYGFGEKIFAATIERIIPMGQSGTGPITFPVVLRFDDGVSEGLLPGMAAIATFKGSEK